MWLYSVVEDQSGAEWKVEMANAFLPCVTSWEFESRGRNCFVLWESSGPKALHSAAPTSFAYVGVRTQLPWDPNKFIQCLVSFSVIGPGFFFSSFSWNCFILLDAVTPNQPERSWWKMEFSLLLSFTEGELVSCSPALSCLLARGLGKLSGSLHIFWHVLHCLQPKALWVYPLYRF